MIVHVTGTSLSLPPYRPGIAIVDASVRFLIMGANLSARVPKRSSIPVSLAPAVRSARVPALPRRAVEKFRSTTRAGVHRRLAEHSTARRVISIGKAQVDPRRPRIVDAC
jgi:hypothetical protein